MVCRCLSAAQLANRLPLYRMSRGITAIIQTRVTHSAVHGCNCVSRFQSQPERLESSIWILKPKQPPEVGWIATSCTPKTCDYAHMFSSHFPSRRATLLFRWQKRNLAKTRTPMPSISQYRAKVPDIPRGMKRSCAITPAVLAQTLWNATKQNEFTYFLPQLDVAKHKYDFGTGHDNVAFTWWHTSSTSFALFARRNHATETRQQLCWEVDNFNPIVAHNARAKRLK